MIRILFFVFLEILSATPTEEAYPSSSFFSAEMNPQVAENCSPILVDMIKSSDYDFGRWMPDANPQEVKDVVSFLWDTWNDSTILVRLFFDWIEDPGTGTMTWMRYDLKNKRLLNTLPDEIPLHYDKEIEKKFLSCIKRFKEE